MTSDAYRWQAGTGAIAGALVADAIASGATTWTPDALRSIDIGELMLLGSPAPIELEPHDAVAAAITGLGIPDAIRQRVRPRDPRVRTAGGSHAHRPG